MMNTDINNAAFESEDVFLRIKKGDAIKCQNTHCSEMFCVYNSGNLNSMKCSKCIGLWVKPGRLVPALSYTTCTLCSCQFMVEKPYRGKNPYCRKCRPAKEHCRNIKCSNNIPQSTQEKLYCGYCNSKKSDVTFGVHPFNSEIYDDQTLVWMCKECRDESYMDT